ncbi:MAG: HupE/UreJ family protein [Epsilonproteobacteria bacterium]|nr:MAG: HupE/UreJ family protein [Campylobacterota bacterium]
MKLFFILFLLISFVNADEVRPSYLQIQEQSTNQFSVLFKVPAKGDKKLSLHVKFPNTCTDDNKHYASFINATYMESYSIRCTKPLAGKSITIKGLENTKTDLLLRLEFLDKTSQLQLLKADKNSYLVLDAASNIQVVQTYTWLGITHILLGFDHLMFVFALLLLVNSLRKLLWTITAFTLAHSITLVGSSLGYLYLPQKPVEAMIALSILFLSVEIMHEKKGKVGITSRYPWVISFSFGLLHGFGFAGALSEIGLPQNALNLALIFFNVGVELGQLIFIVAVMFIGFILHKLKHPILLDKSKTIIVYTIGSLSTFWLIERIASF